MSRAVLISKARKFQENDEVGKYAHSNKLLILNKDDEVPDDLQGALCVILNNINKLDKTPGV